MEPQHHPLTPLQPSTVQQTSFPLDNVPSTSQHVDFSQGAVPATSLITEGSSLSVSVPRQDDCTILEVPSTSNHHYEEIPERRNSPPHFYMALIDDGNTNSDQK